MDVANKFFLIAAQKNHTFFYAALCTARTSCADKKRTSCPAASMPHSGGFRPALLARGSRGIHAADATLSA